MPWSSPVTSTNRLIGPQWFKVSGFFCSQTEPTTTKTICASARSTTTGEKPASKNPNVVPSSTQTATTGETNMAINTAMWLPRVKDIGSRRILTGEIMGTKMPMAQSSAAITRMFSFSVAELRFIKKPPEMSLQVSRHIVIHSREPVK